MVLGAMFSRPRLRKPKKIRELRPPLESVPKNEGATPSCDPGALSVGWMEAKVTGLCGAYLHGLGYRIKAAVHPFGGRRVGNLPSRPSPMRGP
jgi:hypothetical protein